MGAQWISIQGHVHISSRSVCSGGSHRARAVEIPHMLPERRPTPVDGATDRARECGGSVRVIQMAAPVCATRRLVADAALEDSGARGGVGVLREVLADGDAVRRLQTRRLELHVRGEEVRHATSRGHRGGRRGREPVRRMPRPMRMLRATHHLQQPNKSARQPASFLHALTYGSCLSTSQNARENCTQNTTSSFHFPFCIFS